MALSKSRTSSFIFSTSSLLSALTVTMRFYQDQRQGSDLAAFTQSKSELVPVLYLHILEGCSLFGGRIISLILRIGAGRLSCLRQRRHLWRLIGEQQNRASDISDTRRSELRNVDYCRIKAIRAEIERPANKFLFDAPSSERTLDFGDILALQTIIVTLLTATDRLFKIKSCKSNFSVDCNDAQCTVYKAHQI